MVRILSSADPFGYGPCSKLTVVARALRKQDIAIDFFGHGSALTFAEENRNDFDSIIDIANARKLERSDYDAVLSVMSPELAVWGYAAGLPVFTIDSLFWFWQWPYSDVGQGKRWLSEISADLPYEEIVLRSSLLSRHILQYVGHLVSTVSFAQRFLNTRRTGVDFREINAISVEPIVNLEHRKMVARDTVLVSFAGMMNPLVAREEQEIYLRLVHRLTKPLLDDLQDKFHVLLTANRFVAEPASKIFGQSVRQLSNKECLNRPQSLVMWPVKRFYGCVRKTTPAENGSS